MMDITKFEQITAYVVRRRVGNDSSAAEYFSEADDAYDRCDELSQTREVLGEVKEETVLFDSETLEIYALPISLNAVLDAPKIRNTALGKLTDQEKAVLGLG